MIVEYIWTDVNGNPRSKTKVIYKKTPEDFKSLELPDWNFDGSSTGQASSTNSECILKPHTIFPDPFRGGDCIMALCDVYNSDLTPHASNTRFKAEKLFTSYKESEPIFGLEQEFFLMKEDKILAFHTPPNCAPLTLKKQGDYYCGNGNNNAIGRECVESALKRSVIAGLHITGMNAEVAPSQWEIQICDVGISASDQLIMLRYILNRTAEMYNLWINYHPKPACEGDWNGSGCHVNFSTDKTRSENGFDEIQKIIKNLEEKHSEHIKQFGKSNDLRLTGKNETCDLNKFTSGVGDRGASIRIPCETAREKKGYIEDRRPSSNMDPYVVTSLIFKSSLQNENE